MSTKNWMVIMEEMFAGFSRQATLSLQDIKQCFQQSGRSFNEEFKKYFFQVAMNSLTAAYSTFEMGLILDANNETLMRYDHNAANVNQSVAQGNNILSAVKVDESSMSSKSKGGSNSSILILDSDDEASSPEHPTIGRERDSAIVGEEAASAMDTKMEIEDEPIPSTNQNGNNENNAQYEVKKEAHREPKEDEPNGGDDDIPLILIEADRRIHIEPNENLIRESLSGKTNKNEGSDHKECGTEDGNNIGLNLQKKPNPRSADENPNKVSMAMTTSGKTITTKQLFSKVANMYQCQVCEYSSIFKWRIKIHVRVHTGEKPYQCNHCQRCFSQLSCLKNHERVHTGEKPYRCNRCGKCFSRSHILKYHAKVHVKEFAFHCSGCFRGFSQKYKKDTHEKECKLRRYECYVCKKISFVSKSHLKRHMQTHTREKLFQCAICLKHFSRKEYLRRHLNNVHNKDRH